MKPSRPYLVRALYEWLLDNDLTPHLLVDANKPSVTVPQAFVEDGQIVLNINPSAVRDFYIEDDYISFNARFSGQPMDVFVPMSAILALFARENGQGMGFGAEPAAELYMLEAGQGSDVQEDLSGLSAVDDNKQKDLTEQEEQSDKKSTAKKPSLRVIK